MSYELSDAKTGHVILTVPVVPGTVNEHAARCIASTQARRLAAGGLWVMVASGERLLLYVRDRLYAPCVECGSWFVYRRCSERCQACRSVPDAPPAARKKRRKRRAAPDMQLRLPDLDE